MTPERWQQIKQLFHSALECERGERAAFLTRACAGDEALRREVESLVASHEQADSFIEASASDVAAEMFAGGHARLEAGQQIGHYTITALLGAGGMGEVFLAQDEKLDRQVAVKILNEKFSRHESNLQRFTREAKAASALDHPNILVIHEIGEAGDAHYIVSEYVKGKTLRQIVSESPMKVPDVLDIGVQIANALSVAHGVGLIHRDIKPENIIIRPDGHVKVLDFGLAKLVEQKNRALAGLEDETGKRNQTPRGLILGTLSYMSPEQARGERVDPRTDIFSLGAALYEMLAGRTPFAGDSRSETIVNLINAEAQPLSRFAANAPDELQRIISKMLRKNKDERYQTMEDVLADLKDLKESLAFEEKLERSTAAAPKVLTSQHYFKQNESDNSDQQTQISEPDNAFQAYLLWRYHYQQIAPADLIKARAFLEEAVRLDADFALVHTALAVQSVHEAIVGLRPPAECFPQAKDALRRAFDLDPHSAEFYAAAGFVDMVCDWNFTEAERKVRKALQINSHHAFANNYLGQIFMFRCRAEEAEPYLRRAREIEPMGMHNNIVLTMSYFLARNYQKVIEECEKALALYPRYFIAAQVRCWALEQTGRAAEAVAEYEKILVEPHGEIARRWMGYSYALVGNREKALETAAKLAAESREHYLSPVHSAMIYAGLNDVDKAIFHLENGLSERDPWMLWIAADPRFDNLREDARFCALVRRVGLKTQPTESFASDVSTEL